MSDTPTFYELLTQFQAPLWMAGGIAVAGSTLGVFVLLRRDALVAIALPEFVACGAALAVKMHWPAFPTSIVAVLLALAILAWTRFRQTQGGGDSTLPALYIGTLCLTIVLIANVGSEQLQAANWLQGSFDLSVAAEDALWATPVLVAIALIAFLLWRRWLLIAQSPAVAQLAGLHPARWNALFLLLLAAAVLIATTHTGIPMILVFLFLPPAAALPWFKSLPKTLFVSVLLALATLAAGFEFSIQFDWPFSPTLGTTALIFFALSHIAAQFF